MKSDEELKASYLISVKNNGFTNSSITDFDKVSSDDRTRRGKLMKADLLNIYKKNLGTIFNHLFDIRNMKNRESGVPKDLRQLYSEVLKHKQTNKVAVLGNEKDRSGAADFVLSLARLAKLVNVNWFSNEEEALSWLKTD